MGKWKSSVSLERSRRCDGKYDGCYAVISQSQNTAGTVFMLCCALQHKVDIYLEEDSGCTLNRSCFG